MMKNRFRNILTSIVTITLFSILSMFTVSASDYATVWNDDGVLSDADAQSVEKYADCVARDTGYLIEVYVTDGLNVDDAYDVKQWALDQLHSDLGHDADAVLVLMDSKYSAVVTSGQALIDMSDGACESISYLGDDLYKQGRIAESCNAVLDGVRHHDDYEASAPIIPAVVIGVLIGVISTLISANASSKALDTPDANIYLNSNAIRETAHDDVYVTTTVVRHQDSSSSGSGNSTGGGSSHTGGSAHAR